MLDDLVVYEVLLGNGYLMSSLFHEVEEALAELGLAAVEGCKTRSGRGGARPWLYGSCRVEGYPRDGTAGGGYDGGGDRVA